ncbi:MAG: hypothetical protein K2G01_04020, partial [Paramuribaculum sp.]|nr:hypothetical protein [Paramuribaculum sp.]
MKTARIIPLLLILFCLSPFATAKKRQDYPQSEIKAEYNYHYKFMRKGDGATVDKNTPFILLANRSQSKFYCPSTEFKDSLESTPSGRAKANRMFDAAVAAYVQNRDRSAMDGVVYHSRLYVFKDFTKSI